MKLGSKLHQSICKGDVDEIYKILDANNDDAKSIKRNLEQTRTLIETCDPICDFTALHWATLSGDIKLVKKIISVYNNIIYSNSVFYQSPSIATAPISKRVISQSDEGSPNGKPKKQKRARSRSNNESKSTTEQTSDDNGKKESLPDTNATANNATNAASSVSVTSSDPTIDNPAGLLQGITSNPQTRVHRSATVASSDQLPNINNKTIFENYEVHKVNLDKLKLLVTTNRNNETVFHVASMYGYTDILIYLLHQLKQVFKFLNQTSLNEHQNNNNNSSKGPKKKLSLSDSDFDALVNNTHSSSPSDGNAQKLPTSPTSPSRFSTRIMGKKKKKSSGNTAMDSYITGFGLGATDGNLKEISFLNLSVEALKTYKLSNILNITDSSGNTALHYATEQGHLTIVEQLLSLKANVNVANSSRDSPLHIAVRNFQYNEQHVVEVAEDIQFTDNKNTSAKVSSEQCSNEIISLLLQAKADVSLKNVFGEIPMQLLCLENDLSAPMKVVPAALYPNNGDAGTEHENIAKANVPANIVASTALCKTQVGTKQQPKRRKFAVAEVDAITIDDLETHNKFSYLSPIKWFKPKPTGNEPKPKTRNRARSSENAAVGHFSFAATRSKSSANFIIDDMDLSHETSDIDSLYNALPPFEQPSVFPIINSSLLNNFSIYGFSSLGWYCFNGMCNMVAGMLSSLCFDDVNRLERNGCSIIYLAALSGRIEVVHKLFNHQYIAHTSPMRTASGCSLVLPTVSVERCSLDISLSQSGGDDAFYTQPGKLNLLIKNKNGKTALHAAAESGALDILQYIAQQSNLLALTNGRSIDVVDKNGITPLHEACQYGKTSIVKALISLKANVCAETSYGYFPITIAARHYHRDVVQELASVTQPIPVVDRLNKHGYGALHIACFKSAKMAELLLQHKANVHLPNGSSKHYPIHCAARGGIGELIPTLIKFNANVHCLDANNFTPIARAVQFRNVDAVKQLLLFKADPCFVFPDESMQRSLLAEAASQNTTKILKILLESNRSDVQLPALKYSDALFTATLRGNLEAVKLLMQYNAPLYAYNPLQQNLLHCALSWYKHDILEAVLDSWQLNINKSIFQDKEQTALHYAFESQDFKAIELLLNHGAYDRKIPPNYINAKVISAMLQFLEIKHIKTHVTDFGKRSVYEQYQCLCDLYQGREDAMRFKVLVVGKEGVGKTSIIKRILGKQLYKGTSISIEDENNVENTNWYNKFFKKKRLRLATEGIDVHSWITKGKEVVISIWDFAGQEIYYSTHQFFLSTDTLYLLVFNLRDIKCNRIVQWLNSIQARAPGQHILLVGTHCDKILQASSSATVAEQKLSNISKEITDMLKRWKLSFRTDEEALFEIPHQKYIFWPVGKESGIDELFQTISNLVSGIVSKKKPIANMDVDLTLCVKLLKKVKKQRDDMKLASKIPIVSIEEYSNWCNEIGIMQQDHIIQATKQLHSWGEVLFYSSVSWSVSQRVMLDPTWLTKLFRTVLSCKYSNGKEVGTNNGILLQSELENRWKAEEYPPVLFPYLFDLLEHYRIIVADSQDIDTKAELPAKIDSKFMIPTLLPINKPVKVYKHLQDAIEKYENNIKKHNKKLKKAKAKLEQKSNNFSAECIDHEALKQQQEERMQKLMYGRLSNGQKKKISKLFREYWLPFEPQGMMSRLVAQLLDLRRSGTVKVIDYWRTGITLQKDGAALFLEMCDDNHSLFGKVLVAEVFGNQSMKLLVMVHFMIQRLLHDWYIGVLNSAKFRIMVGVVVEDSLSDIRYSWNRQSCIKLVQIDEEYLVTSEYTYATSTNKPNNSVLEKYDIIFSVVVVLPELCTLPQAGLLKSSRSSHFSDVEFKHDIKIIEKLGEGAFAEVCKATWKGTVVALKLVRLDESNLDIMDDFYKEVEMLSSLTHKNIVSILHHFPRPPSIVMELVPGGELKKALLKNTGCLNWLQLLRMAFEIANAVDFMHSQNPPIVHCDLRSCNIFVVSLDVSAPIMIKVGDLGNARLAFYNKESAGAFDFNFDLSLFSSILASFITHASATPPNGFVQLVNDIESGKFVVCPFAHVKKRLHQLLDAEKSSSLIKDPPKINISNKKHIVSNATNNVDELVAAQVHSLKKANEWQALIDMLVRHMQDNGSASATMQKCTIDIAISAIKSGKEAILVEMISNNLLDPSYNLLSASTMGDSCNNSTSSSTTNRFELQSNTDSATSTHELKNWSLLHYAAKHERVACLKVLLKAKADITARDELGNSVLHVAAATESSACLKKLIKSKADINAASITDSTPLHIAAASGNTSCLSQLLRHGAKVNSENIMKATPLLLAANFPKSAEILLEHGATCTQAIASSTTALLQIVECLKRIQNKNADNEVKEIKELNAITTAYNLKPFFVSCSQETLQLLHENELVDSFKKTPLAKLSKYQIFLGRSLLQSNNNSSSYSNSSSSKCNYFKDSFVIHSLANTTLQCSFLVPFNNAFDVFFVPNSFTLTKKHKQATVHVTLVLKSNLPVEDAVVIKLQPTDITKEIKCYYLLLKLNQ